MDLFLACPKRAGFFICTPLGCLAAALAARVKKPARGGFHFTTDGKAQVRDAAADDDDDGGDVAPARGGNDSPDGHAPIRAYTPHANALRRQ
ncbi:hypothetical protein [Paraburkholderia sp. BL18I3N2]|uniref:hypothetical protein n=1 Tax=Paraburkholderia sp. BL18I3N2 TaxID=1938799 RepID=UPI0011B206A5|nr:hypothetical protein [Paraburkholderia sp. BL18I3N2]